jgi:hypothetical protein
LDDVARAGQCDCHADPVKGADVNDELGAGFWFKIIGIVAAIGIGCVLIFWLIGAAWVRWGALGALLFFSIIALTYGYLYDRRQARRYKDVEA